MADFGLLLEAEKRGILPPEKQALLAEARKRGLTPDIAAPAADAVPSARQNLTAVPEEKEGTFSRVMGNIGPDIAGYVGGVANMVRHPVDTGQALFNLVAPSPLILNPERLAVAKSFYEAAQNPGETMIEHPFQTALTVLPGLGAVSKAAGMARTGAALTRAGTLIDPVQMAGKTVLAGGKYVAAPLVDATGRIISNLRTPGRSAGNALLEMVDNNPAAAINALDQTRNMQVTPGYTPTLPERLYAGGVSNPTVAATANRLPGVNPEMNRELYAPTQRNVAALQDQLARVNERIPQQANALAPAAKADLEAVRGSLQTSLDAETAKLGQAQQGITNQLSNATPQTTGATLAERAKALKTQVRETEVTPAYTAAFKVAGNTPIDVSGAITTAEQILGRKLTEFAPESAPKTVAALARIQARGKPAVEAGAPQVNALGVKTAEGAPARQAIPPTATLQELDDIRQAINMDISAAKASATPAANTQAFNLQQLHSALDDVVFNSNTLSDAAKTAYKGALGVYRNQYAPRFKTGVAADLFRGTNKNQPRLLADDTVSKFLTNETSADQFVSTFRNDPAATAAMREGVERLYREKVTTPAQHEKFMQDYGDQLNKLDRAGLGLRDKMDSLGKEVATLDTGRKALEARAKKLGVENMSQLVDKALVSPSTLDEMLTAANGPARTALAQDVMQRATQNLDSATQYLTTNADAIKKVLRADNPSTANRLYNDAVDTAKWHDEFKNIDAPKATDVNVKVDAASMGKFTDAQLHDLTVVAQDIKRGKEVDALASRGQEAAAPNVGKLGTETGAGALGEVSVGSLNPKIIAARNAYKILAGNVNKKVAAELARVMYTNPDAAIAMLQDAAKRQGAKATRRAAYALPIQTLNKLGKPSIAVNALTPSQPETQQ